ncbi:MAG: methyl-accepting chemotaxis protein [Candidatus Nitrospinota bacterium M3_3B_026]
MKLKAFALMGLIAFVTICSNLVVVYSINLGKNDGKIINALGRQRMLSQAMAKTALGIASRGEYKTLENQVLVFDRYITSMRTAYTETIISAADEADLLISRNPGEEKHPAIPFPATFARMVNERFQGEDLSVDILSENPINPEKKLVSEMDKRAGEALKKNPYDIYSEAAEGENGVLYLYFYTGDIATADGCIACHYALADAEYEKGDLLGVRKYKLLFSIDPAVGRAELNPDDGKYDGLRQMFAQTLSAVRSGGEYPLDLAMSKYQAINAVDDEGFQAKALEVEKALGEFDEEFKSLMEASAGAGMFMARRDLMGKSDQLRKASDDLVGIYQSIADGRQSRLFWTVTSLGVFIVAMIAASAVYFNRSVVAPLNGIMRDLGNEAVRMSAASDQLVGFSQSLAEGATEQAAALEESSASLDEISSMTKGNADNAGKASAISAEASDKAETGRENIGTLIEAMKEIDSLALRARSDAEGGEKTMSEMMTAMKQMNTASDEIGKIIKVIEEIAFQTNLLALNAAVEAARAGKHGKGFAVVAEEVRSLAQRSAKAARDTTALIESAREKAEGSSGMAEKAAKTLGLIIQEVQDVAAKANEGAGMADTAGHTLEELVDSVKKANGLISEIAAASKEQATGVEQVNHGVAEMDKVTQINARNAEDSSSAAEKLSAQAGKLMGVVEALAEIVGDSRQEHAKETPEAPSGEQTPKALKSAEL